MPAALTDVPNLIVETDTEGTPVAFMGIDGGKLEMLFLAPEERGRGLGRKLLEYGITEYGVKELAVLSNLGYGIKILTAVNLKKLPHKIQIGLADNNQETDRVSEGSCFLCKCKMLI